MWLVASGLWLVSGGAVALPLVFLGILRLCRREGCVTLSALSGIDALGGAIQREPSGRDP